eukprot:CAMPEP_0179033488 /NCGR_PEP_ID=MMETSP0796-20121207/12130_1 /TAXON_ID=73915 /ORGANISM="Pyrodinium bahamense, Strain pbaha01" /LENGTH=44 /DNA_ID= /DNA_START= /DNA_END= /DNA_ORIENTATION=
MAMAKMMLRRRTTLCRGRASLDQKKKCLTWRVRGFPTSASMTFK